MITDVVVRFACVLAAWLAFSIAATAVPGLVDQVDVLLPSPQLIGQLPSDIRILAASDRKLTLISSRKDLVLTLYGLGAAVVIPSNASGCIDLQRGPFADQK